MIPRRSIHAAGRAPARGAKTFFPALRTLILAGACAAFPLEIQAQEAESDGVSQRGRANFPFARLAQKAERSSGTLVLPGAAEALRKDGNREARKEQNYWSVIRQREAVRFGAINNAQMKRDLQEARAKGLLASRSASGSTGTSRTSADSSYPAGSSGQDTATQNSELPSTPVTTGRKPLVDRVGETLQRTANQIAETIEDTFYPQTTAADPPSSAVFLILVAILILPALAGVFLVLAYLSLRGGHRLQSGVFAATGLVMAGLVAAAVLHRQAEPDRERLRAECAQLAITVTASVQEFAPEGAVLAELRASGTGTAITDRNGCAFLFTTDTASLPTGRTFTRVVYPAGNKTTRNVFGLPAEMPAYTDSFDHALSLHEQNVTEGRWWQKLLRPLNQG